MRNMKKYEKITEQYYLKEDLELMKKLRRIKLKYKLKDIMHWVFGLIALIILSIAVTYFVNHSAIF